MTEEYRKIDCPWCHAEVFTKILAPEKTMVSTPNGFEFKYILADCPECKNHIRIVDDISLPMITPGMVLRFDDLDDEFVPLLNDVYHGNESNINLIRRMIDENIGKLRDEWDNPETEKKIKIVVTAPDGTELEDTEEVMQYIRDNYDYCDLEDWINDNFDRVEIGPFDWSPVDVIEGIGESMSEMASCEMYSCNYAESRYEDSDMVCFQDLTDIKDMPEDGETIEVAGITFTYKRKEVEKDE